MTKETNIENYVFGKVQPQAVELEQAVLGAMMVDKDAIVTAAEELKPEDFYQSKHGDIYRAILELYSQNLPVDLLTVMEKMKKNGTLKASGGPAYLAELSNRVASTANLEYHSRIVKQKSILRNLIGLSSNLMRDAYQETTDVFELIETAEQGIFSIVANKGNSIVDMPHMAAEAVKRMEEAQQAPDGLTGVPTGFTDFDRLTGGLQAKKSYIIAARPGMGKTAFVLSVSKNAADFDRPVAFFSLEMGKEELAARLICAEAGVNGEKLMTGKLSEQEQRRFTKAAERLSELKIFVDETPGITPFELRSKARRLKMTHGIELVIVDYLQLMRGTSKGNNREREISEISQSLKHLSKELEIPVIALSQLSRAVEVRGGSKRPQLSDLRESGTIEQDSDFVAFLYRPEYYKILEDEEGQSLKGICEVIIAKNRGGRLTTVKLKFDEETTRFHDLNEPKFEELDNGVSWNRIAKPSKMNDDEDIPF